MSTRGDLIRLGFRIQGDGSFRYTGGDFNVGGAVTSKVTANAVATAGAATYTIAQLLAGLILRDPAGADRSDVSPTAALIVGGLNEPEAQDGVFFSIRNTADADETITLTAGTGVTLSGKVTINRGQTRRFVAVATTVTSGSEAVTIYDLGLENGTYTVQAEVPDVSTASSVGYTVAPYAGRLIRVFSILHGAITVGDAVLTIASSVGDVTETITIAQSGSAAGDIDSITPATHANTVVAGGTLLSATSDGGSTDAAKATVVFVIEMD